MLFRDQQRRDDKLTLLILPQQQPTSLPIPGRIDGGDVEEPW